MLQTNFEEEGLVVNVYDTALKTIVETYDNYKKAGNALQIKPAAIARYVGGKKKIFSIKLQTEICFRIGKKQLIAA